MATPSSAAAPASRVTDVTPDEHQRRVIDHAGPAALVLAGAGTGKTTTVAYTVAERMRRDHLRSDQVLTLTFSRRAATDLAGQIGGLLQQSVTNPLAMTFHSLALALVRRFWDRLDDTRSEPMRLLTAPQQTVVLRDLLAEGRTDFGARFAQARTTRAFSRDVGALLTRARQLGLDPDHLIEIGERADRPDWRAVGEFFEEYLDVLDAMHHLDYAELVHRARLLLADPEVAGEIHDELRLICIDELQDCDPAQVALVRELAGPRCQVVAFADPDQSIYGFRGAGPGILRSFWQSFTHAGQEPALLSLQTSHRAGANLLSALSGVARRLPVPPGIPALTPASEGAASVVSYRSAQPASGLPEGEVQVWECSSEMSQAHHIAQLLRRAHLVEGRPWTDMAVLVRSGRASIPVLSRALIAAGVPVRVAGDEVPLASELAVRPLLAGLEAVAEAWPDLDADTAARLLTSPLGGLDSVGLRRLGRQLRASWTPDGVDGADQAPPMSTELIARVLTRPEILGPHADESAELRALVSLHQVLAAAREKFEQRRPIAEVLWSLWSGTDWPQRLRRRATVAGEQGLAADRDLDAVLALFDLARRHDEGSRGHGVTYFLDDVAGQQIPASTVRPGGRERPGVALMTAHRAKGEQWPLVVVAGAQEGTWPDLRRRSALLEPARLGRNGMDEPPSTASLVAEERRLFLVACARAAEALVVSTVLGTEGEGDAPSRFAAELGVRPQRLEGRPERPLSLSVFVGELRRCATDPQASPALREAATKRLGEIAAARDKDGSLLVPQADPDTWWGMTQPAPTTTVDLQRLTLSAGDVESLLTCPRSWFLTKKARAQRPGTNATSIGNLIHVLAERMVSRGWGQLELADALDRSWQAVPSEAPWLSASQRAEVENALERLHLWHQRQVREVIGVEVEFEVNATIEDREVTCRGRVDRLERDVNGRLWVVDFKTGRTVTKAEENIQLAFYQWVVAQGGFDRLVPDAQPGGAELVFLRGESKYETGMPIVTSQLSLLEKPYLSSDPDDPDRAYSSWAEARVVQAVRTMVAAEFPAMSNPGCRWCPFTASCPAKSEQVVA
ncbi:ATP-dependent helicase [Parenemella sanctibonifatiensis]|uniref:DNA 3'-5' helicase n=1 Tax=Parenemella sanctibonifatiensis TaxID=2016505 RepID=A0A255EEU7_9ACTN|nr:ATP-dependent DNA helicase [Parenemella sanctibonifatiensis]OYN86653.1 DNA helicase UvrD [Parenemella sanctibonifatiensis]